MADVCKCVILPIKPLSVNEAWQGRRYKTRAYKRYEEILLAVMPDIAIPKPPYRVSYIFGFSSLAADIDNPIKPLQDIIQKRYKIDDKLIKRLTVEVEQTEKGSEFLGYQIETYTKRGRKNGLYIYSRELSKM